MGKKKLSGAAKRKKKKEKEEAIKEAKADLERLKLGPTKLWTGLVTHHRDIFVSHVLSKLNTTDRYFFSKANIESLYLLKYAGVDVSKKYVAVCECSSISTLEMVWINIDWGERFNDGTVKDQAWFCSRVARTNKLELLKWVREVKKCEWDEETINKAASEGNLEMLKYCFANGCPCDENRSCRQAASKGHLDCLRFLFDKVKPLQETETGVAYGAAQFGQLATLRYFVEEAKMPLNDWACIAYARIYKQHECLNYLREKGCPEPTDEEYAKVVEFERVERRRP